MLDKLDDISNGSGPTEKKMESMAHGEECFSTEPIGWKPS